MNWRELNQLWVCFFGLQNYTATNTPISHIHKNETDYNCVTCSQKMAPKFLGPKMGPSLPGPKIGPQLARAKKWVSTCWAKINGSQLARAKKISPNLSGPKNGSHDNDPQTKDCLSFMMFSWTNNHHDLFVFILRDTILIQDIKLSAFSPFNLFYLGIYIRSLLFKLSIYYKYRKSNNTDLETISWQQVTVNYICKIKP